MSEKELNSYRFLSGDEPTDEMLHAIMTDACDAAVKEAARASEKYEDEYERQYRHALSVWGTRISRLRNGQ